MLNRVGMHLKTYESYFGFKRSHYTETCVLTLKQVLRYYKGAGSPVFVCLQDIKNAFDSVSHNKLFSKLIDRGVLEYLLIIWYGEQQLYISCVGVVSTPFNM